MGRRLREEGGVSEERKGRVLEQIRTKGSDRVETKGVPRDCTGREVGCGEGREGVSPTSNNCLSRSTQETSSSS